MFAPFWDAIDAGGGHFKLVAAADAKGGAVILRRAIFEKLAAGDEVSHDALLGIHAEEGSTGRDGGAVTTNEGCKIFVASGRSVAVGLGGTVCEANADEGFGVGKIDRGDVERGSGDRAGEDGNRFGGGRAEDLGGEGEGGIARGFAGNGHMGRSACTGWKEDDIFGEMGEKEKRESDDRAGSLNKAGLGGGSAAFTVTEGWTTGRSGHAGRVYEKLCALTVQS